MYDKSLRTSAVITARDCFNYDIIAGISLNRPLGDGRISAPFASTHGTEYGWSPKSCYVVPLCRLRNGMSDQANRLQKQEWFKSRLLVSFRAWLLNFARKEKLHHRKVILYTILSVIYLLASRNFLQSLNSLKTLNQPAIGNLKLTWLYARKNTLIYCLCSFFALEPAVHFLGVIKL